jgi:AraC-like DNA-binding protein
LHLALVTLPVGRTPVADLELEYAVPSPDLAPYVSLFYRFAAPMPVFRDIERAARAQLRFRLSGGESEYHFSKGVLCSAPVRHLIGPTCGATRSRADGPLLVFGLGLTAAGWEAMVGLDASATRGVVLDADALFGPEIAAVDAALKHASSTAAMVAATEPFLRRLIRRDHGATLRFVAAVDDWLAHTPADLDTLAATTGLSRRQVERRCNQLYGAPPKLLQRKYRALRAATSLAADGDAADPVLLEGFYDQSHMIREIKQFAGLTPRRMRSPGPLARLTIRQRRALDGQVHSTVSHT